MKAETKAKRNTTRRQWKLAWRTRKQRLAFKRRQAKKTAQQTSHE